MYSKISQYFTIRDILKGLSVGILGSLFIYLSYAGVSIKIINTIAGVMSLYLLIGGSRRSWFWSGFFLSLFWFWWILMSFRFYDMLWAVPIGTLMVVVLYGFIFWLIAWACELVAKSTKLPIYIFHATALLCFSFIHPLGFDWFKPELMFTESYFGIFKWQFAIILLAIVLAKTTTKLRYLWIMAFAFGYQALYATSANDTKVDKDIKLVTTEVTMDTKWQTEHKDETIKMIYAKIDNAIKEHKKVVVLPESIFPLFLNTEDYLMAALYERSKYIDIVVGGLYWDNGTPRNSTYIFSKGTVQIINKVVLVPFGERNPLPDWLGDIVNKIFFKEGVLEYKASETIKDYNLKGTKYRNAICYEATSEQLYTGNPKNMIVISNNGWFTPSIEPALQRLLLQYYSLKYGTTIYHSANMSPSYVVKNGVVDYEE